MKVTPNSTILTTKNSREVEIKRSERGKHCGSGKHYVEMTNNVERIVEKDIHTSMRNSHPTNTSRDEEKDEQ